MNEQKFASFLESISYANQQSNTLLEGISYIDKFYQEFEKGVKDIFDDKLDEFRVSSGPSGEIDHVSISVQERSLYFDINFKNDVIEVKYSAGHGLEEKDQLYINDGKVISKEHSKELSEDLLRSYLDLFV